MKKIISVLLTITLVLCFTIGASASSVASGKNFNIQEYNPNGQTKIDSNDFRVSDVLTFDEITETLAKDKNISREEAAKIILKNESTTETNNLMATTSFTYRTLAKTVWVSLNYAVELRFYCRTDECYTGWGILEIKDVEMKRDYIGGPYDFVGKIYINLENAYTIFYIINGTFYKYANTSYSTGVSIPIGKDATIFFSASVTNNLYKYFYREDRAVFQ